MSINIPIQTSRGDEESWNMERSSVCYKKTREREKSVLSIIIPHFMICPWIRKSRNSDGEDCPRCIPEDTVLPVLLYSCAQLRRWWCCCFSVCFQKHLCLTTQGEPLRLFLSENTAPMCQFAWRGKQLCARLWLANMEQGSFRHTPPLISRSFPTSLPRGKPLAKVH